jgi:hypothetical protein
MPNATTNLETDMFFKIILKKSQTLARLKLCTGKLSYA